jgi:hypothetical protein
MQAGRSEGRQVTCECPAQSLELGVTEHQVDCELYESPLTHAEIRHLRKVLRAMAAPVLFASPDPNALVDSFDRAPETGSES